MRYKLLFALISFCLLGESRELILPESVQYDWVSGIYPELHIKIDGKLHRTLKLGNTFQGDTIRSSRALRDVQSNLEYQRQDASKRNHYLSTHEYWVIDHLEVPVEPTFSRLKDDIRRSFNRDVYAGKRNVLDMILVMKSQYGQLPAVQKRLDEIAQAHHLTEDLKRDVTQIAKLRSRSLVYIEIPALSSDFQIWINGEELSGEKGTWKLIESVACTAEGCPTLKHRSIVKSGTREGRGEGKIAIKPNHIHFLKWQRGWLEEVSDPRQKSNLEIPVPAFLE